MTPLGLSARNVVLALAGGFAVACTPSDKGDGSAGTTETGTTGEGSEGSGGSGSGGSGTGGSGSGESGTTDTDDIDWDSLFGSVPESPTSAPTFSVVNYDGAARTREDLLGHPTVMWFYPAAATSG
jgi:hypothetical protein